MLGLFILLSQFFEFMGELVTLRSCDAFLKEIRNLFPTYVASVICDRHGFPIASNIAQPTMDESTLALAAITNRKIMDLHDYHKLVRPLSSETRMMLLLKKSIGNIRLMGKLNHILERRNPM
jgi:hypothetical protein